MALGTLTVKFGTTTVTAGTGGNYSKTYDFDGVTSSGIEITVTSSQPTDKIYFNGSTTASVTGKITLYKTSTSATVKVTEATASAATTTEFTVTIVITPETVEYPTPIQKVGWFAARFIEGDFDAFIDTHTESGTSIPGYLPINLDIEPKYVISMQITKGYTGYFDTETKRLYVYSAKGSSAVRATLKSESVKYQLIVMQ